MATSTGKAQKPALKLTAFRAVVESKIKKLNLTKLEEEKNHVIERKRELQEAIKAQDGLIARLDMAIFDKRERRYADVAIAAEKAFNEGGQNDPDLKAFMKVFRIFEEKLALGDVSKKGKRGRPARTTPPLPTEAGGAVAKSKKGQ